MEVVEKVEEAWEAPHWRREICVLITLDVKNAFNSAKWQDIFKALETLGVPAYLRRIIEDYLHNREVRYETTEGEKIEEVTSGVAQGSSMGPDIWNINYDGVLRLNLPEGTSAVGFADDLAIIVTARSFQQAKYRAEYAVSMVSEWLKEHSLELAASKTEMVVLERGRTKRNPFCIKIEGVEIVEKPSIRYLGVTIDRKLTFAEHIKKAADKASIQTGRLARLMPNLHGPTAPSRMLLMSVSHSTLLYGSEVWGEKVSNGRIRELLLKVQRKGALRISSAYRTVSTEAILVLAGTIPLDLLALERRHIYICRDEDDKETIRLIKRMDTMNKWQERWSSTVKGAWTKRLIPDVREWYNRRHGELDFHLTQFLSGHGQFNDYLYKRGRKATDKCEYCIDTRDSVEHTFYNCKQWQQRKRKVEELIGWELTPQNTTPTMLESSRNWTIVKKYVEDVLKIKIDEERRREKEEEVATHR